MSDYDSGLAKSLPMRVPTLTNYRTQDIDIEDDKVSLSFLYTHTHARYGSIESNLNFSSSLRYSRSLFLKNQKNDTNLIDNN